MTKTFVKLLCAVLLGGGLVAGSATAAQAATPPCTTRAWTPLFFVGSTRYSGYIPSPYSCYLTRGMNNNGVRALQTSLRVCNGQNIVTDGSYGYYTYRAVLNVQRAYNASVGYTALREDGIYGPNTREVIRWYASANGVWRCGRIMNVGGA